jgi:hypothetical protein
MKTIITFSDDVIIDGKSLKKGKYALYTIPNIQSWEVIFILTDNWGTPKEFNEANVALRTVVKRKLHQRQLRPLIGINGLDTNFAYLEIYWENSRVALKFEVPTQKKGNGKHRKCIGRSFGRRL